MGHIVGKDVYRKLGRRLDQSPARTPWTPVFRQLVEELYSPADAELVVRLPYRPSTLERVARMLKEPETVLRPRIENLCAKGLVVDIWDGREYLYMVSPIVIGF